MALTALWRPGDGAHWPHMGPSAPRGNSTCGVTTNGQGYCWVTMTRDNWAMGQPPNLLSVPLLQEKRGRRSIWRAFACGVTTSGAGLCWGNNFYGNLGNGSKHNSTNVAQTSRTQISGGHSWSKIEATNGGFTCGITTSGAAYCWGTGSNGVLGNGSTTSTQQTPVAVSGGLSFSFLTGADSHICGLASGGQAHCWGYDGFGQLGSGRAMGGGTTTGGYDTSIKSTTPQAVAGGHSFVSISTGNDFFSCGVATGGKPIAGVAIRDWHWCDRRPHRYFRTHCGRHEPALLLCQLQLLQLFGARQYRR